MSNIPDCVSTLELSKLWIEKALKEIEAQNTPSEQLNQNPPVKEEE
jgi:hypothetical protein